MRRRLALAATLASLALAVAPHGAGAGTVSVNLGTLQFFAGGGEANNLSISQSGSTFTVTDSGGVLTPVAPECTAVNANTATCDGTTVGSIFADLGDAADTATITESVRLRSFNASTIFGGSEADNLSVRSRGFFFLLGSDGNDTISGGPGRGFFDGGPDEDTLEGGSGGESLDGGPGNDTMRGGPGFDSFEAGDVPDGADFIDGGPERDFLSLQSREDSVFVNQNGVADDGAGCPGPGCEGDNVTATVEGVFAGDGADTLIGGPALNNLGGGDGNDAISGGAGSDIVGGDDGDDSVRGDGGDDEVFGGEGADAISGGGGDDRLFDDTRDGNADVLAGGTGLDLAVYDDEFSLRISLDNRANDGISDPVIGGAPDNVRADVEGIEGGTAADILIGSAAPNELIGGAGNDRLVGKKGADGLIGGRGNDLLSAGAGRDTLDGEGGVDRLRSRGGGPDEVDCGASSDNVRADRRDRIAADCEKVRR